MRDSLVREQPRPYAASRPANPASQPMADAHLLPQRRRQRACPNTLGPPRPVRNPAARGVSHHTRALDPRGTQWAIAVTCTGPPKSETVKGKAGSFSLGIAMNTVLV